MGDLQNQIDDLTERAKSFLNDGNENKYNILMEHADQLKKQLVDQLEVQQERIQKQEEKVSSITLPHDFNTVFADPRANDMIIELIQIEQRRAYAEHNAEVEQLHTEYKEKFRAADKREIEYKYQNDQLQKMFEEQKQSLQVFGESNLTLNEDRRQAIERADTAEKALEQSQAEVKRLNEHIDTLRTEAAIGAREAVKVHDVGTSDKLNALVQQSMAEKAKTAYDRFLERNKDIAAELDLKPIEIPEVQPFGESFPVENATSYTSNSGIPIAETVTVNSFREEEAVLPVHQPSDIGGVVPEASVTREEFESYKKEVNARFESIIGEVA